jgi:hypothetical protein
VVVAILELDLEADAPEEGRRRVEEKPVHARREIRREVRNAPVRVRLGTRQQFLLPELDADAVRGTAALDVEDMGGE